MAPGIAGGGGGRMNTSGGHQRTGNGRIGGEGRQCRGCTATGRSNNRITRQKKHATRDTIR